MYRLDIARFFISGLLLAFYLCCLDAEGDKNSTTEKENKER
jgi:hypothetical protein